MNKIFTLLFYVQGHYTFASQLFHDPLCRSTCVSQHPQSRTVRARLMHTYRWINVRCYLHHLYHFTLVCKK